MAESRGRKDGSDRGGTDDGPDRCGTEDSSDRSGTEDGPDRGGTEDGSERGGTDDGPDRDRTKDGSNRGGTEDGSDGGAATEDDAEEGVTRWLRDIAGRGRWSHLVSLLNKGELSATQARWIIRQICERQPRVWCGSASDLAKGCPEEHLDFALTRLVAGDHWRSVRWALERGLVSTTRLRWVMDVVSGRAAGKEEEKEEEEDEEAGEGEAKEKEKKKGEENERGEKEQKKRKKQEEEKNVEEKEGEKYNVVEEAKKKEETGENQRRVNEREERWGPLSFCPEDMLPAMLGRLVARGQWVHIEDFVSTGLGDPALLHVLAAVLHHPQRAGVLTTMFRWNVRNFMRRAGPLLRRLMTLHKVWCSSSNSSSDINNSLDPASSSDQDVLDAWLLEQVVPVMDGELFSYASHLLAPHRLPLLLQKGVERGMTEACAKLVVSAARDAMAAWLRASGAQSTPHSDSSEEEEEEEEEKKEEGEKGEEEEEEEDQPSDEVFWIIAHSCQLDAVCVHNISRAVREHIDENFGYAIQPPSDLSGTVYRVLIAAVSHILCTLMERPRAFTTALDTDRTGRHFTTALDTDRTNRTDRHFSQLHAEIVSYIWPPANTDTEQRVGILSKAIETAVAIQSSSLHLSQLCLSISNFLRNFVRFYQSCRQGEDDDAALLNVLACVPLLPYIQTLALEQMTFADRWGVLCCVPLSHVPEHSRIRLLQSAVSQRQWGVVKRWAGQPFYGDLRVWMLQEAQSHQQWDVVLLLLLLSGGAIQRTELLRACGQLAYHAGWDLVLSMVETGVDITEVLRQYDPSSDNSVTTKGHHITEVPHSRYDPSSDAIVADEDHSMIDKEEDITEVNHSQYDPYPDAAVKIAADHYAERRNALVLLERDLASGCANLETALMSCQWSQVLCRLRKEPAAHESLTRRAVSAAVEGEAWPVVGHLTQLVEDEAQRTALFPRLVQRGQWSLCQRLLERGVGRDVALAALKRFLTTRRWVLVTQVMTRRDVPDDVRRDVVTRAMRQHEGRAAVSALRGLREKEEEGPCLSQTERDLLMAQALAYDVWPVITLLVEGPDGARHRDRVFQDLPVHGRWVVADHCLRHGAHLDAEDESGATLLQRAAVAGDWVTVGKLLERGADPSSGTCLRNGRTVLHNAVRAGQWDLVRKLMRQQPAKLDTPDKSGRTPVQMILDKGCIDVFVQAVELQPSLVTTTSSGGVTALHAACLHGHWAALDTLVTLGADPLALASAGSVNKSVLLYAAKSEPGQHRRLAVAACLQLGLSTCQPSLTSIGLTRYWPPGRRRAPLGAWAKVSPFCHAFVKDDTRLYQVLYQSGSCSNAELFALDALWACATAGSASGPCVTSGQYLHAVASTPRALTSLCRLVVSHALGVRADRQGRVQRLPVTQRVKDYVSFSDLVAALVD